MIDAARISTEKAGISLVDGDPAIRRARQIMLRSERYDVRSYATGAALLADPRSRDFPCIIVDVEMDEGDDQDLLQRMRASGWRGKAILLDGLDPHGSVPRAAGEHGDRALHRAVEDRPLIAAIEASIDRGWSGWTAGA